MPVCLAVVPLKSTAWERVHIDRYMWNTLVIAFGSWMTQIAVATTAGFALSVHELDADDSIRLQAQGVGGDRRLGWGIFVPAKAITTAG